MVRNENETEKPSRVNARDIRPRETQVSTDQGGKKMRKRSDFNSNFLEKDRSGLVHWMLRGKILGQ